VCICLYHFPGMRDVARVDKMEKVTDCFCVISCLHRCSCVVGGMLAAQILVRRGVRRIVCIHFSRYIHPVGRIADDSRQANIIKNDPSQIMTRHFLPLPGSRLFFFFNLYMHTLPYSISSTQSFPNKRSPPSEKIIQTAGKKRRLTNLISPVGVYRSLY
jgi:hypothetical protein